VPQPTTLPLWAEKNHVKTLAENEVAALQSQRTRIVYWFIDFDGKWLCFKVTVSRTETGRHGYKGFIHICSFHIPLMYFFTYRRLYLFPFPVKETHRSFPGLRIYFN
jgi:hypothetical protein